MIVLGWRVAGAVDLKRIFAGPLAASLASAAAMVALRGTFALAVVAGLGLFVAILVAFERRFYPDDARALAAFLRRRDS